MFQTQGMCGPLWGLEKVPVAVPKGEGAEFWEMRPLSRPCAEVFTLVLGGVIGRSERVSPSTCLVPILRRDSGQLQGACGEQAASLQLTGWPDPSSCPLPTTFLSVPYGLGQLPLWEPGSVPSAPGNSRAFSKLAWATAQNWGSELGRGMLSQESQKHQALLPLKLLKTVFPRESNCSALPLTFLLGEWSPPGSVFGPSGPPGAGPGPGAWWECPRFV